MSKNAARAIILAAGFGSRLMPHTKDKPKCMVEIDGKTILERQTEVFSHFGIKDIAIVSGHASSAIPTESYSVFENQQYSTTNMVASLMCARDWLSSSDTDLIISYGDIVFNSRVFDGMMRAEDGDMYVVSDTRWLKYWEKRMEDPLMDAETFRVNESGYVTELGKKPKSASDIEGQYIGLQRWSGHRINDILRFYDSMDRQARYDGQNFENMYMTSFLQLLADNGFSMKAVPIENGWLELDTDEDYNLYQTMIKNNTMDTFYELNEFTK